MTAWSDAPGSKAVRCRHDYGSSSGLCPGDPFGEVTDSNSPVSYSTPRLRHCATAGAIYAGIASAILFPTAALAGAPPLSVSGYVAFMNMYENRGLSQSVGEPAVHAELDLDTSNGFYGGLDGSSINWVDQVYPGDSVSTEIDLYAGYKKPLGGWTLKGGILRLLFPGRYAKQKPPVEHPNTTEVFGYIGWRWFSTKLNYSMTNSFGNPNSRGSWYLDVSANTPAWKGWSVGAHLGRREVNGENPATSFDNSRLSYTDYKLSTKKAFCNGVEIELDYVWTNADSELYTLNGYEVAGNHFVFQLADSF